MLYKIFYPVLLALGAISLKQNKPCPNVTGVADFEIKSFEKTWYIIAATTEAPVKGDCATFSLAANQNDSHRFNVSNRWVKKKRHYYCNGTASINEDRSTLYTVYPDKSYNMTVLDTDYEHYALLYSCNDDSNGSSSEYEIWKLSHTRTLNNTYIKFMNSTLEALKYNETIFKTYNNNKEKCVSGGTLHLGFTILVTSTSILVKLLC